jgi:HSP20 family protein
MAERKQSKEKETVQKSGNGHSQQDTEHGRALTQRADRSMHRRSNPLSRLRGEFDRLFDDFFHGWPSLSAFAGQDAEPWGLEVQDRDDAMVVRADAPGFEPSDFDVQIRGNNLVVSAAESEETSDDEKGYRWQKREFYRSFPLPAEVDADKIDAQYHNGLLTLTLPKTEASKTRKIEIKG